MDIRTLIVSNLLLTLTMGLLVLVYRIRRRDLGFGLWGAGSLLLAAGFLALLLRGAGLPVAASVLAVNACFAFGATLRLDGISHLVRERGLPRPAYLLPATTVAIASWFLFADGNLAARTFVINGFLAGVTLAMAVIVARTRVAFPVYRVFAGLNAAYALLLLGRAAHWLLGPERGIFQASLFDGLFFLTLLVFEVTGTVCLLMMNGTRIEARLRLNEARLEGLLEISGQGDRSEAQLLDFALHKALVLTGSAVGYVFLYHEGTRQFVLSSRLHGVREDCAILEKQTVYDLDTTGIWGDAVRQRQPILVNDFAAAHPLKQDYPDGHEPLRNFLTVPIFSGFEIVAVVGVANKDADYDASDIVQLSLLMESLWRMVERVRAEAALDARNSLLDSVLNSPDDVIIFSVDRAYCYTSFNEKHRRMMGLVWNAEIRPGLSILDMMTDRVLREEARASFDRALAGESFTEIKRQPEQDLWFEFSWNPIRTPAGEVTGVAAFVRDISGNKRAEEALRESETRFRTLFENMTEGVALHEIVRDAAGAAVDYRLLDVNAGFEHHTGIAADQARGALASVLYGAAPPFLDRYARVAQGGAPLNFDIFYPPLNKHFKISVVSPKAGQFATVFEDITERKRREEELRLKSSELERFIYTVSHDLRSPLVTVKTFLGYLEEDIARAATERIAKDLQFMRSAGDKMEGLLDDLLEMSRVGRVVSEPVTASYADLAAEAVALVAGGIAERGVAVQIEPADIALRGDRARLVEIWQNAVENAVKFMGGQPAPLIRIGVEHGERGVVFFVSDNGAGFDPRYREKIFGLFERLDPAVEGTGLGLALIKRIVEFYGGVITADSDGPGRGATIRFTLPGALVPQEPRG